MKPITIRAMGHNETRFRHFAVAQDALVRTHLDWGEMLAQIASLTHPDIGEPHYSMKPAPYNKVGPEEIMFAKIVAGIISITPVGSRVTCDPPPENSDEDYLVLVQDLDQAGKALVDIGFVAESQIYPLAIGKFASYRRGDLNFIVTADTDFHQAFMAATTVAHRLNLLNKEDRIALFDAVILWQPCAPMPIEFSDVVSI